jgi:hypothetical protein
MVTPKVQSLRELRATRATPKKVIAGELYFGADR